MLPLFSLVGRCGWKVTESQWTVHQFLALQGLCSPAPLGTRDDVYDTSQILFARSFGGGRIRIEQFQCLFISLIHQCHAPDFLRSLCCFMLLSPQLIWLQNWGMSKKRREELPEGAKGWHARYLLGLWAKHHWCIRCHDWQLPLKHAESCWALWLSRLGLLDVTSDDLTLIGYAGGVFSVHLPVKGLPVSRTGIQDGWQF